MNLAENPKILFRVDASLHIGTGHVMRCLTLAHALTARGAACQFVCRAHKGNLISYIKEQGFAVTELPFAATKSSRHADWLGTSWETDAAQTQASLGAARFSWMIVDHYALDNAWETAMRPFCHQLMVIDDLADRAHECDLLLDQNLGRNAADYQGLAPPDCPLLLGPDCALLRPEFAKWRAQSLERRAKSKGLKSLLITMGGVDQHNITGEILAALKAAALPDDAELTVVMGPHAPWLTDVKAKAAEMPWPTHVRVGVSNMAELMAEADLAIGAAGSTSWERCCLGLPTLALVLADNQRDAAGFLEEAGAVILLGDARADDWRSNLHTALSRLDAAALAQLSEHAQKITDGTGAYKCLKEMRL